MELPLPNPQEPDIYSFGFDKSLNKGIADNATGVVYDSVNDTTNTGSIPSGGNLILKTLSIGGLVRQVAPGDDIQAAIDAVNREGGGTVQLLGDLYVVRQRILLRSNVLLAGAGRDITVLDFDAGPYGLQAEGATAAHISNFGIKDLTLRNSNLAGGILIQFGDTFRIDNVKATLCLQKGIYIQDSTDFSLDLVYCLSNTGDGLAIYANTAGQTVTNFSVFNSRFRLNGGNGCTMSATGKSISQFSLENCDFNVNSGAGLSTSSAGFPASVSRAAIINCRALTNVGTGFSLNTTLGIIEACNAETNIGYGFDLTGSPHSATDTNAYNSYVNNKGRLNGSADFNINSRQAEFIGNQVVVNSRSTTIQSRILLLAGTYAQDNFPSNPRVDQQISFMRNGSALDMNLGDVVVFSNSAQGDAVANTTTPGDNKIFGVSVDAATQVPDNHVPILREGYAASLNVYNGLSSITLGSWLSADSHTLYARKASAGDTAFAISLSAPTTSTAVVSAILFSPRLI